MTEESHNSSVPGPGTAPPAQQTGLNRRVFGQVALGAAAVAGAAGLAAWSAQRHEEHGEREPAELSQRVVAARTDEALPRDPLAAVWRAQPPINMPLVQQYMVAPRLQPEGMIPQVTLRALHNGREIGFHVAWADSRADDLEAVARFRDSVAVQVPVSPEGPVTVVMGQPGRPVHILHWRASWQRTVRDGPRDVRDLHPFAVNDRTPEEHLGAEQARVFYPALVVGNPMATRERTTPVEELVAQGFGTITSHEGQRADGYGVHTSQGWEVVVVMPMAGGQNQPTLSPGGLTAVAVAVWDGAKGDRGARKQFANWVGLELEA
jgi:DMSO reductase family type II enzyme heme b subunit